MARRNVPRHYQKRRNDRAFWEPTPKMKAHGFQSVPLGPDGPEAFRLAEEWNRRWDATRTGQQPSPALADAANLSPDRAEALTVYPSRSLGAAFRDFRLTHEWAKKSPRTREEWHRGWRWIKPVFGDVDPRTVTLAELSDWRAAIAGRVSDGEAWRAMKTWRALWKVAGALQLCNRDSDPSLAIRNSAPKGRSSSWSEGEAVRIVKRAWRMRFYGLAAAVAVAWDTQLDPGDVRALRASQLATDGKGGLFVTERGKTSKPVGGMLSARTMALFAAYLDQLGVEMLDDAFLFRTRSGDPYKADRLGRDFAIVRDAEFGDGELRTLGHDFRRSGAMEAIVGDATPAALSHAMGNTLSASNFLFATYVPVNSSTIRSVRDARLRGRGKLR
jgi:hypothetical protein